MNDLRHQILGAPVEEKREEPAERGAEATTQEKSVAKAIVSEQPVAETQAPEPVAAEGVETLERSKSEPVTIEAKTATIELATQAKLAPTPRPVEPTLILEVSDLSVGPRKGRLELDHVSLKMMPGETVVLFGERGCGKEALVRAVGGALTRHETMTGTLSLGSAHAAGRAVRLAYLPGPYLQPLSPHASVVTQLSRVIMRKLAVPENAAREELRLALARFDDAPAFETLAEVPSKLAPENLSFALLAAAMAQTPELVLAEHFVADIPLIPSQRLIAALLAEQKRLGFALLYSARGAHVLNWLGGRVIVMRTGRIVEEGSAVRLASGAAHAYTQTLFRGLPRVSLETPGRAVPRGEPMLQVRGLELGRTGKSERALSREGLTFELRRGSAIALVGEEGSGRRRLARTLIGLERPGAGRIVLDAVDIGILSEAMLQRMRRRVAFIVGTDDVLDDRMTIWDTVAEPLRAHLNASRDVVANQAEGALKRVGLAAPRTPVAVLSAFDRRRLQIARAIVTQPHIAIVDEPLRGLDAFGQGVIRDLLKEFRRQEGPAFLIITADFSIADAFAEEAFVFAKGRVIERGPIAQLLRRPKEAETRRLIDAVTAAALPKSPASV